MKNICIVLIMLACSSAGKAQSWFEAGKPYVYSYKSDVQPGKAIVLTVIYDTKGTATVSRTQRPVEQGDGKQVFLLCPENEIKKSSANPASVSLDFGDAEDYWFIDFENFLIGKQNISKMGTANGGLLILKSHSLIVN